MFLQENSFIYKTIMKTTIYVKGMHCIACETILKKACEKIPGVKVLDISAKKWTIDIETSILHNTKQIHQCIQNHWYTVSSNKHTKKIKRKNILWAISIVVIIIVLMYSIDIPRYMSWIQEEIWFGMAVLIGIIASVSTCMAVVGSIVIWFSEYLDTSKWIIQHIKTQTMFHIGRIGGFFVLWWLLGAMGKIITISFTTTTIITICVGIIIVRMWLHILRITPNISTLWIHLPKRRWNNITTKKHPTLAPLVGALTFFLPCGFTLSMQLIAIHSGSFLTGGILMALFALGTMPALFALGIWSSYIKEKRMQFLHTIIGILIILFGSSMIINSRRIIWWYTTQTTNEINNTWNYEHKEIAHNGRNTIPNITYLDAKKNYTVIITPERNGIGCMSNLIIPKLDRTVHQVLKDTPITYTISNKKKWTYTIVCGTMGMEQGKIIIQ